MNDRAALYRVLQQLPDEKIGAVLSEALTQLDAVGLKQDEPVTTEAMYREMICAELPDVPGKDIDLVWFLVNALAT